MLNKFFNRSEFECRCGCGFSTVDAELLSVLTDVREYFNAPVTINSSCRCDAHNKAIGGAEHSKHKLGIAADIVVKGVNPADVYDFLDRHEPMKYGVGKYDTFTHVDVRANKARW